MPQSIPDENDKIIFCSGIDACNHASSIFTTIYLRFYWIYLFRKSSSISTWIYVSLNYVMFGTSKTYSLLPWVVTNHYDDVIMGAIAFQITSLTIVSSTAYSDADQRKHQSSASLAFVQRIHREAGEFPALWQMASDAEISPFNDVIIKITRRTPRVPTSPCLIWGRWNRNSLAIRQTVYFECFRMFLVRTWPASFMKIRACVFQWCCEQTYTRILFLYKPLFTKRCPSHIWVYWVKSILADSINLFF